jgi:hypothetical protein
MLQICHFACQYNCFQNVGATETQYRHSLQSNMMRISKYLYLASFTSHRHDRMDCLLTVWLEIID